MKRYDAYNANWEPLKDGRYVLYSEAIEVIAELKAKVAHKEGAVPEGVWVLASGTYEEEIATLTSRIEEQERVIAELRERLNKSWEREDEQGHDVLKLHFKAAERDQEIAELRLEISDLVTEHEDRCGSASRCIASLNQEIAELKRQHFQVTKKLNEDIEFYAHQKNLNGQLLKESQANLSRLTAALNDDARAEKVLLEGKWPMGEYGRQEAINDYRTMLREEMK